MFTLIGVIIGITFLIAVITVVEGMNRKINLVTRKSFGFRIFHGAEIALYHALVALPEPEFTHRFC